MNEDEYLAQIMDLCKDEDWAGALLRVQSALDAYPHSAQFWRIQGQLILRPESGWEQVEALESFQQAVQFDPSDAEAQLELGRYLLNMSHDPKAALAPLKRASELGCGEDASKELAKVKTQLDVDS